MNHILDNLQRFRSLSFMYARPFEQFTVRIKKSYRTRSLRRLRRAHDTVKKMSSAENTLQNLETEVHGDVAGTPVLTKKLCGRWCGVPFAEWVCLFLEQVAEGVQRAKAAVQAERPPATVLGELLSR